MAIPGRKRKADNGICGFEPDRVIDLPDGTLGVTSHLMRSESQEFAQVLWTSDDRGQNLDRTEHDRA